MTAENPQRIVFLLAGLLSANCALAHHSYAQFDRCNVSTIESKSPARVTETRRSI